MVDYLHYPEIVSMRFYTDSDRETLVCWYPCVDGAKPLGMYTRFASGLMDTQFQDQWKGVGQVPHRPIKYGKAVHDCCIGDGVAPWGTKEEFARGIRLRDRGPIPPGLIPCLPQTIFGSGFETEGGDATIPPCGWPIGGMDAPFVYMLGSGFQDGECRTSRWNGAFALRSLGPNSCDWRVPNPDEIGPGILAISNTAFAQLDLYSTDFSPPFSQFCSDALYFSGPFDTNAHCITLAFLGTTDPTATCPGTLKICRYPDGGFSTDGGGPTDGIPVGTRDTDSGSFVVSQTGRGQDYDTGHGQHGLFGRGQDSDGGSSTTGSSTRRRQQMAAFIQGSTPVRYFWAGTSNTGHGGVAAQKSINGGSFTSTVNTLSDMGNGWYTLLVDSTETATLGAIAWILPFVDPDGSFQDQVIAP